MRKNLLGISILGVIALTLGFWGLNSTPEKQYQPRNNQDSQLEAQGAIDYMKSIQANQITGEIDPADVHAAEQQLAQMSFNKTSAIGLNWKFMGPDNYGGRTRALIIDKDSNQVLYAAGVSGGIFKSFNGGQSWVPISDDLSNINVVALAQAANGDLYAGTGESLFTYTAGTTGNSGKAGGGVFKSTDHGQTWTVLQSTVPVNSSSDWTSVGELEADPNNANRIYASTRGGFRSSDDGGVTWGDPVGFGARSTDMTMGSDGSIWTNVGALTFYSPNGNTGTFVEKSSQLSGPGNLPRNAGRQRYAIAPTDENVVYCLQTANSQWNGLYITEDKGATWTLIQDRTSSFTPLCSGSSCQGHYDLFLTVSPFNKYQIYAGGMLQAWEWKKSSGWRQVNVSFPSTNPFYIHSDMHEMIFDPVDSNVVYITSDGGITKSSNSGLTWQEVVKNYSTTQFYHMSVGLNREIIGGTQDQGSFVVRGNGNTPETADELGYVNKPSGNSFPSGNTAFKGDGFYSHISWLDDDQYYTAYQNGVMGRSRNSGEDLYEFFDGRMLLNNSGPGSGSFAGWSMPYINVETTNDAKSTDSVYFKASPSIRSLGFSSDTTHVGSLTRPQASANFIASSFNVVSGGMTIVSDANGNLSGSGHGTFDAATGAFDFTFNNKPVAEILITCNVDYSAGSDISVSSFINELPYKHTLAQQLNANDSVAIQDPVQAMIVCGINSGIWITREPFNWSVERTEWWKVANISGTPTALAVSEDGSTVWAGSSTGRLVRIAGIDKARDKYTADIILGVDSNRIEVDGQQVANFGRYITSISVHPNDPNKVAVTLGNYGNTNYVRYSSNAMAASPSFQERQGNLPEAPVYGSTFLKDDATALVIGTEFGIFSTDDVTATSPTWSEDNNGMPRVSVFTLQEYRTNRSSDNNTTLYEKDIFAGTHGRGLFRADDRLTARPISIEEEKEQEIVAKAAKLEIFPNPAVDFTNVKLKLSSNENVTIFVRDINGRLMNQLKFNNMPRGEKTIRINTSDFAAGTYIMNVQRGEDVTSGKFIVTK